MLAWIAMSVFGTPQKLDNSKKLAVKARRKKRKYVFTLRPVGIRWQANVLERHGRLRHVFQVIEKD